MFRKILIANRGEIAMRIIRGCRELNIATAAIYSEADSSGIYVKKADESYLVGPGPVKGFLDGKQIVEIAKRIGAAAAADLVLAIYNPASRTRTWQVGAMRDILLEHRKSDTPVVIGRDVAGPNESVRVVTLGELDPAEVDMRCLLIIGSSQTIRHGDTVFTPRTYPG